MKKTGIDWWSYRAWILFGCCITAFMTISILINWQNWPSELKLIATMGALIPLHVVEEWIFPGGFSYQYNTFLYNSDQPDRYPMNRVSDMFTVLGTTILYVLVVISSLITNDQAYTGVLLASILFSLLEIGFHTYCGIRAYFKYKKRGKTTIYGPGFITAYLGFGALGTIMLYAVQERTIDTSDWIVCAIFLGLIACLVFIPETVFKRKNSPYFFPSSGYYERFKNK